MSIFVPKIRDNAAQNCHAKDWHAKNWRILIVLKTWKCVNLAKGGQFSDFYEITLFMFFKNWPENSRKWQFSEGKQKLYIGWTRKTPGIYSGYHFFTIFLKNYNFGLKIKILKFLGIQPMYTNTINENSSRTDSRSRGMKTFRS